MKKTSFAEQRKLYARYESGGSQEHLVDKLLNSFMKPLVEAMSKVVLTNEESALFDTHRPLNNSTESDILKDRCDKVKIYLANAKKVENDRRDVETGVTVAPSKLYQWLQQQSKACSVAICKIMYKIDGKIKVPEHIKGTFGPPFITRKVANLYIEAAFEAYFEEGTVDPVVASRFFRKICEKRSIKCTPEYQDKELKHSLHFSTSNNCIPSVEKIVELVSTLEWDSEYIFPMKTVDENFNEAFGDPDV